MFQKKIVKLFNNITYVFGSADDIPIASFYADGRDHDVHLEQVLWRWRQANLKLNKEKCLFRQLCIPFISKEISRHGVSPDPAKVRTLIHMPPSKTKRELQSFLGRINDLSKFSPMTAEVYEPLRRLTSVNAT